MKQIIAVFLLCLIQSATAMNRFDVFSNNLSGDLLMAISDEGVLYEYADSGWETVGVPCPGTAPFILQLKANERDEREVLIFVIDSSGQLYQTNGVTWVELITPPEVNSAITLSSIISLSSTSMQLVMLSENGDLFINDSDTSWVSPFETFPSSPPRDLTFYSDEATNTISPFIIGADGMLYGYYNGCWQTAELPESEWNIQNLESYIHSETGTIFMIAVDGSGQLYDNANQGVLASSIHDPCPGTAPWDFKLVNNGPGIFDLLCLDSTGQLFLAYDGSWNRLTDSFPQE